MGSDFITKIGRVAEVFDGPHATPKKIDTGPYFLSISSLEGGQLDLSKSAHVSEEQFTKWTKRVTPREGDVLFSYETRLGEAALMPGGIKACLGRRMGLLRPDLDVVLPEYLLYAYLAPAFQTEIKKRTNHGATVNRIALKELPDFDIRIPPLDEQRNTVEILKSMNEKLSLNNQINQTLEQMAQALFKSWFVDFDPVKAKMNGAQPKGMDAATASLFPEKLVESELGLIPEGWEVGTLSDVAKYCSARTNTDTITLENYISTENMLAEKKGVTAASKLPTAKTVAAYKSGDILVSNIRPYFKKIWLAEGSGGRSNDVLGFESVSANSDSYLMNLLYQDTFFEYMTRTSKGAKMPRGDKTAIMNWEMVVPPVELRETFSAIVDKFYQLIPQNRAQNATLVSLRDTLLPKLLSGEIDLENLQVEATKAIAE
ncbi:restriction endonuclease subunit S [Vibrio splendidus]